MMPMTMLAFVLIICFFTRCAFRLFLHPGVRVSDTYFHLKMMRLMKQRGWKAASRLRSDYPTGYHWLIALFASERLLVWERINAAVFDTLQILVFVLIFEQFSGVRDPSVLWFWAPLLLALYPGWLHQGYGPRAYDGTERVFSELLVSVFFCCIWMFQSGHGVIWLALASAVGGGICLSSKFGTQVLVFFSIALAILERSVVIAGIPAISMALATGISRGLYLRILRGQVRHLSWYARLIDTWANTRNYPSTLIGHLKREGLAGLSRYILVTNSLSVGILHNVPLWCMLIATRVGIGSLPRNTFAEHWLEAGLFFWALTSIPGLLFLGEPERYMLATAIPSYFLIGGWAATISPWLMQALAGYCVLWWALQQLALWHVARSKRPDPERERSFREFVRVLNELSPANLLAVGDSAFNWKLAFYTHHDHWLFNPRINTEVRLDELFTTPYCPNRNVIELLEIRAVAVEKGPVTSVAAVSELQPRDFTLMFENSSYALYVAARQTYTPSKESSITLGA